MVCLAWLCSIVALLHLLLLELATYLKQVKSTKATYMLLTSPVA